MGCKNSSPVTKPVMLQAEKKSTILTPAIIRRNLKTEIMKNNGRIRKIQDDIIKYQTEHYVIRNQENNLSKLYDIDQKIKKARTDIFHYETHNMILELHLDTAAPGAYPHEKKLMAKRASRNLGISKMSSLNSSKMNNYGYLTTEASSNIYQTKPSGLTENEWGQRRSLHSIISEGSVGFLDQ